MAGSARCYQREEFCAACVLSWADHSRGRAAGLPAAPAGKVEPRLARTSFVTKSSEGAKIVSVSTSDISFSFCIKTSFKNLKAYFAASFKLYTTVPSATSRILQFLTLNLRFSYQDFADFRRIYRELSGIFADFFPISPNILPTLPEDS